MKSRSVFRQRGPKDGDGGKRTTRNSEQRRLMEEEGFERRRDSSSKAKEHRVAEHRALLPFLTFREQESLPHRVASSPKTLHHPLRTEILLTPLKVRFIFTRMEFNYISHLSFLFFSLSSPFLYSSSKENPPLIVLRRSRSPPSLLC